VWLGVLVFVVGLVVLVGGVRLLRVNKNGSEVELEVRW